MPVVDQQEAIVQAALQLLAAGGPQALRIRDIAEAAGCTTMTVYSRFGGKDGVVEAIYVDGFRRFTEALKRAAAEPAGDRGKHLGVAYRSWALQNPGSYQVMFTEAVPGFSPSEEAAAIALISFDVLIDAVRDLQSEGHIRPDDPNEIAWALWGMTHGLVMLELASVSPTDTAADYDAIYASAMTAIMRGLASDRAPRNASRA